LVITERHLSLPVSKTVGPGYYGGPVEVLPGQHPRYPAAHGNLCYLRQDSNGERHAISPEQ